MSLDDPSTEERPIGGRSAWRRVLSGVLLIGAISYIVWYFTTHREELEPLTDLEPWLVALVVGLQVMYLLPQAGRYQLVLERQGERPIPRAAWFRLFVVGRLLNSVIPQSGNVYRSVRLKNLASVRISSYVGGFLTFTWLTISLSVFLALVVTATVDPSLRIGDAAAIPILTLTLVVVAASPFVLARILALLRKSSTAFHTLGERAQTVVEESLALPFEPKFSLPFLGLSLVGYGAAVAVVFLVFRGIDADIGVSEAALFLALLQISTIVNLTPSNIGVQEIGFAMLANGLGIGIGTGLLGASIVRVTGIVALLLAAVGTQVSASLDRRSTLDGH